MLRILSDFKAQMCRLLALKVESVLANSWEMRLKMCSQSSRDKISEGAVFCSE